MGVRVLGQNDSLEQMQELEIGNYLTDLTNYLQIFFFMNFVYEMVLCIVTLV